MNKRVLLTLLIAAATGTAYGYEEDTHEDFSQRAVDISVLSTSADFFRNIGLESVKQEFQNSLGKPQTIENLFQFGARHEDSGTRFFNHFFDVQRNGEGLWFCDPACQASPDWILDGSGQIAEFSYRSAQRRFVSALSGTTEEDRQTEWGLLFQTLGHVIHHTQDMAQPEHVRNDAHPNAFKQGWYERYTDSNAGRVAWKPLLGQAGLPVALDTARSYWTNPQGSGIAEFTSRNFVSKDTNFDSGRYDSPSFQEAVEHDVDADALFQASGIEDLLPDRCKAPHPPCVMTFLSTPVTDRYRPEASADNPRTSTLSIFDPYLKPRGMRRFTLNRFNFNAAYEFLVPRAVSYSAGLIDHFFRGRLEFNDATSGGGQIRIDVKNVSDAGNAFGPGTFTMYYESNDGTRKILPIASGSEIGSGQMPPQGSHTLAVDLPHDLNWAATHPYVLIYQGVIGVEHAVTGLVFDVPSAYDGFIFTPSAPLSDGQSGSRLVYFKDGQWNLHPQTGFSVGTIDWKGWYKDGRPTRVLSWSGGDRYFHIGGSSPHIYQNGKPFVVAPYWVLGAALQKDANGKEWVIAICEYAGKDVVLKRPATPSTSSALYDAALAPDGWQRIGELTLFPGGDRRAWLFNGNGTEAQTMRRKYASPFFYPLTRLRITTDGVSASIADLGNTKVIRTRRVDLEASSVRDGIVRDHCEEGGSLDFKETETVFGENVVAVDYRDMIEVLARVQIDATRVTTEQGTAGSGVCCFGHYTASQASSGLEKQTLQFGSISYELVNGKRDLTGTRVDESDMHVTLQYVGEASSLAFMDLRTDTLIVRRGHGEEKDERIFTGIEGSRSGSGLIYHEYLIKAAGALEHLTSQVDKNRYASSHPESGGDIESLFRTTNCVVWKDSEHMQEEHEIEASLSVLEPPSIVGAAHDKSGHFWVSLKYGDTASNTFQYFNFLTGGDPVAITGPVSGASTQFLPIAPQ